MLSEGSVVEAGHPHLLLKSSSNATTAASGATARPGAAATAATAAENEDDGATFSSMVEETGPASAQDLRRLARAAWEASEGRRGSGTAVA